MARLPLAEPKRRLLPANQSQLRLSRAAATLWFYLENSAKTALSITLLLPQHPDGAPLLPLITPYLSQSQHLNIACLPIPDREPSITHDHFPLLKSLESSYPVSFGGATNQALESQLTIVGLEGIKFPWTQLTQLTIQFRSTIETLTLLRHCSSLEVFRLGGPQCREVEASRTPSELKTVHHGL
ncbi:hypothetical protein BD779DRAFT_1680746 [Infundibulicybe gibba]|nr:hypothetical protein BD779DRAFT_1680746 [Infundibulicybe gibba]